MDFGSIATFPSVAPDVTVAAAFNTRLSDDIVRLGINYKFDPMGAVIAKN